jgi:F-type H+-transporting ATPase subunit gamma
MTAKFSEISDRITGIKQLGSVVNAMRGIAASRAQQARTQLSAVDSYSAILAAAIGRAMALAPQAPLAVASGPPRLTLVIFCAEQGFAGTYSERVLEAAGADLHKAAIFLVGTRGAAVAAERGITPAWTGAVPSQSGGIPRLADTIADALYVRIAAGKVDRLDTVYARWDPGKTAQVERHALFPLDPKRFAQAPGGNAPLLDLPPLTLLTSLTADYVQAQLCAAALQAFASENQARMEAMAAAHTEIGRKLAHLQGQAQIVRQEEITEEIIELAAGEAAGQAVALG